MGWMNLIKSRRRSNLKRIKAIKDGSPEAGDTKGIEADAIKGSTYNIDFAEAGYPSVIVGADSTDSMEQTSLLQSPIDTEDDELKKHTRFVGGLSSSKNISI